MRSCTLACFILLLGLARADDPKNESGVTQLFNGKDLTGWGYKGGEPFNGKTESDDKRFSSSDGILTVHPGKGVKNLFTTAKFDKDFELRLEFRAEVNADSGVFLRGTQLQCRDYLVAGPYKNLKKYKPQEWNQLVAVVHGTKAFCTCNGEVLENAFTVPASGPIGVEADRGQMEYRNIRLKELPQQPKKPSPDDQYTLGPDSQETTGVPKGTVKEFELKDSKTFPGYSRKWWIYIPAQYDGKEPAALMVFQDGGGYVTRNGSWRVPVVFDNLIHKKQMPVTVGVFINPGTKPAPAAGAKRNAGSNRSVEYDTLSDKYATFLLDEILPEVRKHAKISDDPEKRAICGSSSGGICAFTVAWEKPDQFLKALSTIGSFTNIRGGNKYPELVKSSEKKPIRVFMQDGANDLINQYGNWPEANKAMYAALKEKGYDVKFEFGEGTHNPKHGASILPDALRWLWRDGK